MKKRDVFLSDIPKKSLGQHFLTHEGIQDKIVDACRLDPEDIVFEIGPGKGAITRKLARRVKQVIAVEKDRSLAPALQESFAGSNVMVIESDVMDYDFDQLPQGVICVGNLPYNMAAPIIEKVLCSGRFTRMYAMVQLEQGERMVTGPGSKEYGSLSCFVQFHSKVKKFFEIRPSAFLPPPKVQSVFLGFEIFKPEERPLKIDDPDALFRLIRTAFLQRRKTIINALGSVCAKEVLSGVLKETGIAEKARPEEISLADYVALTKRIQASRIKL